MKNQQAVVLGAIAVLGLTGTLVLARPFGNWRDHFMAQSPTPSSPTATMQHSMPVSSEFDYLAQMIPHHQEAIATAQIILQRSRRPEMQAFARQIIAVQSAEIEQMQDWLKTWYPDRDASVTYQPMMRDLSQLEGDALDQTFLQDMIGHHMGAVMMSQMLLNHNLVQHPPVQSFAQNIATTQRQEIHQMQAWLLAWFGDRQPMGRMHHGS
ncbi:DUF305 domain-containing protein [Trichothermofontia sichuanensis B231]|uniref:DUF305 domain-containing protein n=1 Tax=Trichothermofontia sichuanensis TaxID=3045816 RepID=UPI002248567D|nr:DUF305 domain-containing protein [Trichothermofontia sichuanensis]UZQ55568.1 DUF305 domain-containing protein [Trichothermofontia sichuanensis B231]